MESLLASKKTLQSKTARLEKSIREQTDLPQDHASCNMYIERANNLLKISDDLLDNFAIHTQDEEYQQHEDEISAISEKLEKLKLQLLKTAQTAQQASEVKLPTVEVRLPKLELPTFDGNLDEWLSFRDLFMAAVHDNAGLTGAQKLQYLKASVKGTAALLLQSVSITNDNYEQAWDLLNDRYQNRREIVTSTLKRLVNHPPMRSDSPLELRKLVDNTMECIRSLKVMKVPVEHWDVIISYLIVDKLDRESKQQWELNIKSGDIPELSELIAFLDKRSRALSNLSASRHRVSAADNQVTSSDGCPKCRGNHFLNKCHEFTCYSLEDKKKFVEDNDVCENCLRGGHTTDQCRSTGCRKCGNRHHTMICDNCLSV
jgi:Protein of unknown function (DUF1759).